MLRIFRRWLLGETGRASGRFWLGSGAGAEHGAVARGYGIRLVALAIALGGCGYEPVYGGASHQCYEVTAGPYSTAHFEAVSSALAGARSELGAAEALAGGYPRVIIEVLRVDERSAGVRSNPTSSTPLARGTEITVVGRARVLTRADASPSFDSGDMSRAVVYASGASSTADAATRSRAVRDAARALGRALARAVLGIPEPAEG